MHYLPEVGDDFIDALIGGFEGVPTPQAHVITAWMGGAVDRVAPRRYDPLGRFDGNGIR